MREASPRQRRLGSDYDLNVPVLQTLQRDSAPHKSLQV